MDKGLLPGGLRSVPFALLIMTGVFFTTANLPALEMEADLLTDREISSSVRAALGRDSLVPANLVRVQTIDGVVTLDGWVETLLAKRRSSELAETVEGVQAVVNRIEVIPLARGDDEIETDVINALRFDPFVDPDEVQVRVRDEKVFLTGSVNSPAKKSLVEQIVEGVSGVQAIQNDIDFAPAGIRPDAQIEEEIKSRLKYDALVDASFIDVNVEDGHVTLAGRVSNAAQKRLAVQDAWVGGVKSVDAEKLRVSHLLREQPPVRRQVELPSDEAIERAAAISLTQDPRVPADAVAVDVANGAVTLSGQVASLATKRAVEQDISNIVGVSRVNNKLEVVSPSLSDSAIEERIREAFGRNPYLARADLVVSVTEGRVVLSGIAEHSYQISEAEELASRVRGVRQVENKIHLQESFG